MTSALARDDPQFVEDVKVWHRYLVHWCRMSEDDFAAFVKNIGSYSAGVVFHEEAWYHVFNYLTDPGGSPPPFPDAPNDFFRWEQPGRSTYPAR
jgi:hypothetical protein